MIVSLNKDASKEDFLELIDSAEGHPYCDLGYQPLRKTPSKC